MLNENIYIVETIAYSAFSRDGAPRSCSCSLQPEEGVKFNLRDSAERGWPKLLCRLPMTAWVNAPFTLHVEDSTRFRQEASRRDRVALSRILLGRDAVAKAVRILSSIAHTGIKGQLFPIKTTKTTRWPLTESETSAAVTLRRFNFPAAFSRLNLSSPVREPSLPSHRRFDKFSPRLRTGPVLPPHG